MEKITIEIDTEYIELNKLLKMVNLAASGGEANTLITQGLVQLDGEEVTAKRKKIYPNTTVVVESLYSITVYKNANK